jgi:hypothetical protein
MERALMPSDPAATALSLSNSDLADSGYGRIGMWNHRDAALNCINGSQSRMFPTPQAARVVSLLDFFRVDAQR